MQKNRYRITRLALLLVLAISFDYMYFAYLSGATTHISIYENGRSLTTAPISIDKIMEEISPIAKIPIILLRFNVWAKNNVIDLSDGKTSTSTNLNTNIGGRYTITPTGSKSLIGEKVYFYYGFLAEKSITSFSGDNNNLLERLDGKLTIFYKPTLLTIFLVLIIFMIPLSYASIAVFSACLKFILTGKPFTDAFDERE